MSMADKRFIAFRLRKTVDDDLFDQLKGLDGEVRADLIRTALRRELGIRTHRIVEVKEVPLQAPKVWRP
jgi:hypothetical protein